MPEDAAPLAMVGVAAWRRGIGRYVSPEAHARVTAALFEEFLREAVAEILVAEVDGAPVGFVATEGGEDFVSDLWVSPANEGQGVGSALLEAVEDVVRNRGYPSVRLEVMTVNERALALYRRRGFEVTWQGVQYDKVLETDLHKTHMRKTLAV